MSSQAVQLKESFIKLSRREQLELMQYFLQVFALPEKEDGFELSEQWKKELDRRAALRQNGETQLYSLDEVMKEYGL